MQLVTEINLITRQSISIFLSPLISIIISLASCTYTVTFINQSVSSSGQISRAISQTVHSLNSQTIAGIKLNVTPLSVTECSSVLCWNIKNLLIIGKVGEIVGNERQRDWGRTDLREYKEMWKTRLELASYSPAPQILLRDSWWFCPFQSIRLWSHFWVSLIFWSYL